MSVKWGIGHNLNISLLGIMLDAKDSIIFSTVVDWDKSPS